MESLGIDFKLLVSQIINFLVLFVLLSWLLYKPIIKLLSDRERKVRESLEQAEKTKKEAEELEIKINQRLEESKKQAKEILDETHDEAAKERKQVIAETQKEAEEIIKKTKEQIDEEKETMRQKLKKDTINITILAASKILGKNLETKDQEKLIKETLNKVEKL